MNEKQKFHIRPERIEIIEDCEVVLLNDAQPEGEDQALLKGETYTGYLKPVFNAAGEFVLCIDLVGTNFLLSCIPCQCVKRMK